MRSTLRLLATASQGTSQYLNAHAPTGLTGILTHPFPRPALLYTYSATLAKLAQLPEASVYRQATEALTRQRLAVVDATLPAGFAEWQRRVADEVLPDIDSGKVKVRGDLRRLHVRGRPYIFQTHSADDADERVVEWDGERVADHGEGPRDAELRGRQAGGLSEAARDYETGALIENEPPLTRDQISAMEEKIGGGLIEEVIRVAEREHELVSVMLESRVWEDLEEPAPEGQWAYFERNTHAQPTQKPPQ